MTRKYMVVFEKGAKNWSAFSPEIPGCGSLGDTLDETRENMQDAIHVYLEETIKDGEPIPDAVATGVNIEEFDPNREAKQYVIEWLPVAIPKPLTPSASTQAA
jgi:predicted RNase H-like HicB family nuclease